MNRRALLILSSAGLLTHSLPVGSRNTAQATGFKAIVFDGFAIFDPRPVAALAEALFPGRGRELMNEWRARQFEYQWLRALGGQYADFLKATEDSLVYAFGQLQLHLPVDLRRMLLAEYSRLQLWPDARIAIQSLHQAGLRLAILSNMTNALLQAGIKRNGLDGIFEVALSTDDIRSYKPAPAAYRMAPSRLGLRPEEILFVAFAGWDVAGAKWFGLPVFWVNRANSPAEELGTRADAVGQDLQSLVHFCSESARG